MAFLAKQYTLTTSAAKLTTILGLSQPKYISQLILTGTTGNTAKAYFGHSNVTNVPAAAGGEIGAGAVVDVVSPSGAHPVNTDEIYIVGTAADVLFITLID
jgi:hypothetical protein